MSLSKTANFSISTEGEKWPPFPRLESRGPIEAKHSGNDEAYAILFPRLKSRGPIEAGPQSDHRKAEAVFLRLESRGPIEAVAREDALARSRLIS